MLKIAQNTLVDQFWAIVNTMAASLGMDVVAEGVETQEQSAILQADSCHRMQGYLFSKLGTAVEIGNRLSAEVVAKRS